MNRWWRNGLDALNDEQWEALCDGCGWCCLHKLEDDETGEVHYTSLACELLDLNSCQCSSYSERAQKVPNCLVLTKDNYREALPWLPETCAYKRVAEGRDLPKWHPLRSGVSNQLHLRGHSVMGKVRSAAGVCEDDYQDHLLKWVDQ